MLGPEVLEFDADGNVLRAWGNQTYVPGWPGRLQTIGVDRDLNVYLSGTMPGDSIIKFTQDGKFVSDFGHRGPKVPANQVKQDNQQTAIFPPGIAAFEFDEDAREIYIPDGFLNKRVLVYDMDTGAFKRGWGGHGTPLNEIDNDPTPPYDVSRATPGSEAVRAGAALCASFPRRFRLRLRTRQRPYSGVHEAGQICEAVLDSAVHAIARPSLRRNLEHD